jgi:tetratricopeptide (TPR) repeat protein
VRIGDYEVLGELGRGGMGVVYKVRTPAGGEAALKLLAKTDPATLARFERERRLLGSLGEKDGFVGLVDAGVSAETPWLVMPLVEGGTLRKKLATGPLGVDETVALGLTLARALGKAHARGIVHRDVKPENVLFTAEGRALLADLGLAKHFTRLTKGASQSFSLTAHGAFKGTAGYMAPEQVVDAASAGPPADVFALGAVLYECLAGRPAFPGESVLDILSGLSSGSVAPIRRATVPPWLEQTVRRALARDPRERFADGAALAHALELTTAPARSPWKLALALVLVAGAGLALALRPGPEPAPPAPVPDPVLVARKRALFHAVRAQEELSRAEDDAAIADATTAVELDPSLGPAWELRAFARSLHEDYDGEISDLTRAIACGSPCARTWSERANALARHGDNERALADAKHAIELDPENGLAWAVRADMRERASDFPGAIADATRALELAARSETEFTWKLLAFQARGTARARGGEFAAAVADFTEVLERVPEDATTWWFRAEALLSLGDKKAARADFLRFIDLSPEGERAATARAWLADNPE